MWDLRRIAAHFRNTEPYSHFLPGISPFFGLLLLEVEVPAFAVGLADLVELILHEFHAFLVIDGSKEVFPDL